MNIKDYLHLYLGCQMLYSTHHEPQDEQYTLNSANLSEAINFQDRPILRPLSDMTEEERHTLAMQTCLPCEWRDDIEYALRTKYLLSKGFDLFGLTK